MHGGENSIRDTQASTHRALQVITTTKVGQTTEIRRYYGAYPDGPLAYFNIYKNGEAMENLMVSNFHKSRASIPHSRM